MIASIKKTLFKCRTTAGAFFNICSKKNCRLKHFNRQFFIRFLQNDRNPQPSWPRPRSNSSLLSTNEPLCPHLLCFFPHGEQPQREMADFRPRPKKEWEWGSPILSEKYFPDPCSILKSGGHHIFHQPDWSCRNGIKKDDTSCLAVLFVLIPNQSGHSQRSVEYLFDSYHSPHKTPPKSGQLL